jgi:two-component SAPR family response regulator
MYNVLIADDEVDGWFRINALLRRYLVKASFVSNLRDARKWIEKHEPSILFFNKQLHNQSPLDLLNDVRAKYPHVKIVMLNSQEKDNLPLQMIADLNINKPVVPTIVERVIIKFLSPRLQPFENV